MYRKLEDQRGGLPAVSDLIKQPKLLKAPVAQWAVTYVQRSHVHVDLSNVVSRCGLVL